jgi:hypothetical protein
MGQTPSAEGVLLTRTYPKIPSSRAILDERYQLPRTALPKPQKFTAPPARKDLG